MLLLVVVLLKIFCSRVNSYTDNSFRWCGILFFCTSSRLEAAEMTTYLVAAVGVVIYLCLKTLPLILLVCVLHLPIVSNIGSAHTMCLVRTHFSVFYKFFCVVLVFCELMLPFQWVKISMHCGCGFHICVHKLIFWICL